MKAAIRPMVSALGIMQDPARMTLPAGPSPGFEQFVLSRVEDLGHVLLQVRYPIRVVRVDAAKAGASIRARCPASVTSE